MRVFVIGLQTCTRPVSAMHDERQSMHCTVCFYSCCHALHCLTFYTLLALWWWCLRCRYGDRKLMAITTAKRLSQFCKWTPKYFISLIASCSILFSINSWRLLREKNSPVVLGKILCLAKSVWPVNLTCMLWIWSMRADLQSRGENVWLFLRTHIACMESLGMDQIIMWTRPRISWKHAPF